MTFARHAAQHILTEATGRIRYIASQKWFAFLQLFGALPQASATDVFIPRPTNDSNVIDDALSVQAFFDYQQWRANAWAIRNQPQPELCFGNLSLLLSTIGPLGQSDINGSSSALTLLPTAGTLIGAPAQELWVLYKLMPLAGVLSMFLSFGGNIIPADAHDYNSDPNTYTYDGYIATVRTEIHDQNAQAVEPTQAEDSNQTLNQAENPNQTLNEAENTDQAPNQAENTGQTPNQAENTGQTPNQAEHPNQTLNEAEDTDQTLNQAENTGQTPSQAENTHQTPNRREQHEIFADRVCQAVDSATQSQGRDWRLISIGMVLQLLLIATVIVACQLVQSGGIIIWWCQMQNWMLLWYLLVIVSSLLANLAGVPFTKRWTIRVSKARPRTTQANGQSTNALNQPLSFRGIDVTVRIYGEQELSDDDTQDQQTCPIHAMVSVQGLSDGHAALRVFSKAFSIGVFGTGTCLFASSTLVTISIAAAALCLVLGAAVFGRVISLWMANLMIQDKPVLHQVVQTPGIAAKYIEAVLNRPGLLCEIDGYAIVTCRHIEHYKQWRQPSTYFGVLAGPFKLKKY